MYNETLKHQIIHDLKLTLTTPRFTHVLGVAATARKMALQYGADPDKAEVAGLLHDAAKELPLPDMQDLARDAFGDTLDPVIMSLGSLLHGYAAVTVAKDKYGLTDPDLLASLAHHTTGALQMGTLEKIVFVADYIEPNRDYPGVDDLRAVAAEDLDKAVLAGYDSTIGHLLEQDKPIFVGTVANRNAQIAYMKEQKKKGNA